MIQFLDSLPRLYDSVAIRRSCVLWTKINSPIHCVYFAVILVKLVSRQTMFLCFALLGNRKDDGVSKRSLSCN